MGFGQLPHDRGFSDTQRVFSQYSINLVSEADRLVVAAISQISSLPLDKLATCSNVYSLLAIHRSLLLLLISFPLSFHLIDNNGATMIVRPFPGCAVNVVLAPKLTSPSLLIFPVRALN